MENINDEISESDLGEWVIKFNGLSGDSEWVIKFNGLSWTADNEVNVVHISCVIIAYISVLQMKLCTFMKTSRLSARTPV